MLEREAELRTDRTALAGLIAYLALAVAAWVVPGVVGAWYSVYWACLAAVLVCGAWAVVMPCTCQRGGLLAAMVASALFLTTCGYVLAAAITFVRSLF